MSQNKNYNDVISLNQHENRQKGVFYFRSI